MRMHEDLPGDTGHATPSTIATRCWPSSSRSSPTGCAAAIPRTSRRWPAAIPSWPRSSATSGPPPRSPRRSPGALGSPADSETTAAFDAVSRPDGDPADGTDRLFGGCELLEELGRGGMGVVYRARQPGLGRVVALKRLLRGDSALPHDVARFRAEAEAAARLDHPHIVPVYAVDVHAGEPFFLMKFIAGTTLAKRLSEGPMPAWEAAALLAPVCRAIHYAHEQGVLHRDLKPSNILIDAEGRPHVSDFGLAKRLDADASLTQSGAIVGTPSFMAPEQARAPAADGRARSARRATSTAWGRSSTRCSPAVRRSRPQPRSTRFSSCSSKTPSRPACSIPGPTPTSRWSRSKCLQKAPAERYPSAAALADDLDAFRAGAPVSARSTSLRALAARLLGETHHAAIMENWGVLWICHSVTLIVFFGVTNVLLVARRLGPLAVRAHFHRRPGCLGGLLLGLAAAGRADLLRRAPARPCLGRGVIAINLIFLLEWLLKLPVLTLLPVLAITNGMLFMIKGGILSGAFYLYAGLVFLAIFPMVWFPRFGPLILALPVRHRLLRDGAPVPPPPAPVATAGGDAGMERRGE